ncbi:MAG: hypothetical protein NC452_13225 [Eubacterium sp.]|nr:hypothetical protein [Eubacterium sp.]
MKIKGKGVLRTEQITCRVLVFISAIAFALCIVMEYCFPFFINDFYSEFFHLDFLKNVMLGISGSSIISFICIIFPYLEKRNKIIKKIYSQISSIFVCYLNIYEQIGEEIKKDNAETYGFEIKLYKATQELLEKIDLFKIDYSKFDWSSKDIDHFIYFLTDDVVTNLKAVKHMVSFIVPKEYSNNPLEISEDLKKDIILKRSEKDIRDFIMNNKNEILEMEKIKKIFKKFNLEETNVRLKEELLKKISQFVNEVDENLKKWRESDSNRKINNLKFEIESIKRKHKRQYANEIINQNKGKIKNWNETDFEGFWKALEEDRIDDAKKIIDELKNSD